LGIRITSNELAGPKDVELYGSCYFQMGKRGGHVNPHLQHLIKELEGAIHESLSESDQITKVIAKIKAGGYDVFLLLEATIGFNKRDEQPTTVKPILAGARSKSEPEFKVNAQDVKFLKSLRISLDDAA